MEIEQNNATVQADLKKKKAINSNLECIIDMMKSIYSIPEYEASDWINNYPNMDVKVNVNIIFGKFGRLSKTTQLEEVGN